MCSTLARKLSPHHPETVPMSLTLSVMQGRGIWRSIFGPCPDALSLLLRIPRSDLRKCMDGNPIDCFGCSSGAQGPGVWVLHRNVKFLIDHFDQQTRRNGNPTKQKKTHTTNHAIGQKERACLCQESQADKSMRLGILALFAGILSLCLLQCASYRAWRQSR